MMTNNRALKLIKLVRAEAERAEEAYRKAVAEHAKMLASENAWDNFNPGEIGGHGSANPYSRRTIQSGKAEIDARNYAEEMKAVYEMAVDQCITVELGYSPMERLIDRIIEVFAP
jgi:hypothetical protein